MTCWLRGLTWRDFDQFCWGKSTSENREWPGSKWLRSSNCTRNTQVYIFWCSKFWLVSMDDFRWWKWIAACYSDKCHVFQSIPIHLFWTLHPQGDVRDPPLAGVQFAGVPADVTCLTMPIGSMYGIFTYIWHKFQPDVGKYTIHGSYGLRCSFRCSRNLVGFRTFLLFGSNFPCKNRATHYW